MTRIRTLAVVSVGAVFCAWCFPAAAADLATSDGLRLVLAPDTGAFERISDGGNDLPLLSSGAGGLRIREMIPITTTETLLARDFNTSAVDWNSAYNSDWNTATPCFTWHETGGVNNSGYLQLGDGNRFGTGIAFPVPIPVSPLNRILIRWKGRSSSTDSKTILCVRIFNASGEDITAQSTPPSGWGYSGTSLAHFVAGITNSTANVWEPFEVIYTVPDGASSMTLSLRYWRDGDLHVDVDDLRVERVAGLSMGPSIPITGPIQSLGSNTYEQIVSPPGRDLRVRTRYTVLGSSIQGVVTFDDMSTPPRSRLLRIDYGLPVDPTGWVWGDDILTTRTIEGSGDFENTFSASQRRVSYYPWGAIYNPAHGLALGSPMDVPRLQRFFCSRTDGLETELDLALSPETTALGAGTATFSFVVYSFDPAWGFRASAKKYYDIFPEFFARRTTREGCWEYPIPPTSIPNPSDFGFAFFECRPLPADVRALCAQLGIGIYHYVEPWGAWQNYGNITEKPSYEERMATLEAWAADTTSTARWLSAPRYETARDVLHSAYRDAEGKTYIDANNYFWHQWGGNANQLWVCYPDPDFSTDSLSSLYKTWFVDYLSDQRDGMYVDSTSASGSLSDLQDFDSDHFHHVRTPLSFSLTEGKPVIPSQLAQYDFLRWLYSYEHDHGRTVMGNLFPTGYRFYAPLFDAVGSEVSDVREPDATAALRRTLSYQKLNSNLLQWFRGDQFVTHEQILEYIKNQMFWGIYPGVASCGGGIGWGETLQRYFLHPELYERDRTLFKTYIPVIRKLSQAGWEPIPYATAEPRDVQLERYGNPSDGGAVFFTLRNDATSTVTAELSLQTDPLGFSPGEVKGLLFEDAVSGLSLESSVVGDQPNVRALVRMTMSPADVRVLEVRRPPSGPGAPGLQVF